MATLLFSIYWLYSPEVFWVLSLFQFELWTCRSVLACCTCHMYWGTLFPSVPGGSDSKASACNVGDPGSIPGSGRSSGEGPESLIQGWEDGLTSFPSASHTSVLEMNDLTRGRRNAGRCSFGSLRTDREGWMFWHFPGLIIDLSPALNDNQAYAGKELWALQCLVQEAGWVVLTSQLPHLLNGDK